MLLSLCHCLYVCALVFVCVVYMRVHVCVLVSVSAMYVRVPKRHI